MTEAQLEILKIIPSYLTLVIGLLVIFVVNKKFEDHKTKLTKRKKWEEYWADYLLGTIQTYNETVSRIVVGLSNMQWYGDEKKQFDEVLLELYKLRKLQWELSLYDNLLPESGVLLKDASERLYKMIQLLINNKKGDLEEIRKTQIELYRATKLVYAELLSVE